MSLELEEDTDFLEDIEEFMEQLKKELNDLYAFKNQFFDNHSLDKAADKEKLIREKKDTLLEKFEVIDADKQIPVKHRAQFLYLQGRCYNISKEYDPRTPPCLSKAVKLDPTLIEAWNELGDCYWKNKNVKEAKSSFEGALKHARHPVTLRSMSIILRQDDAEKTVEESHETIIRSVELAKEAVSLNTKDGISWGVLANAYLFQFVMSTPSMETLNHCMSAYQQAVLDPIARGEPDIHFNRGVAFRYKEYYKEALDSYDYACKIDPSWEPPQQELEGLQKFLRASYDLARTRAKIKTKKLTVMVQSIDDSMFGVYAPGTLHSFGPRRDVKFVRKNLRELREGPNEGAVVLVKVVGSLRLEGSVPFTFAVCDQSMECVCVTVYNWANGRGVVIGDCVAIPEPQLAHHKRDDRLGKYDFKSIRVECPMMLVVNGKQVGKEQFASAVATSSFEFL